MKVFEVMTTDVGVCRPEDNLSRAAQIMWEKDCGIVPVVTAAGRVVGVITDRDIAIAAGTRDLPPSSIKAGEMNFRPLKACAAADKIKDALKRMRKHRLRRLCVTNEAQELVGVVSLRDIILRASEQESVRELIFSTFYALAKPAPIVLEELGETADD
ncbi:MAG TPA: CBS domain-containing protein [Pyrinomonadaceae bacterium]|jgi:CBS domain-containing protein